MTPDELFSKYRIYISPDHDPDGNSLWYANMTLGEQGSYTLNTDEVFMGHDYNDKNVHSPAKTFDSYQEALDYILNKKEIKIYSFHEQTSWNEEKSLMIE